MLVNSDEFTSQIHRLTPKQQAVLKLLLEGKSDDETAKALQSSRATVRKHVENICNTFVVSATTSKYGQKLSRREQLIALFAAHKPELVSRKVLSPYDYPAIAEIAEPNELPIVRHNPILRQTGEVPDVYSIFYGRSSELAQIKQWIVEGGCRLLALLGIPGIGKTTLAAKLVKELGNEFNYIWWITLTSEQPTFTNDNVSGLISFFQQHRCLLILDNVERILSSGELAGCYKEKCEVYSELIRRVGLERHQSCLILISREKPKEVAVLEGENLPVHSLQLKGLGKESYEFLEAKKLSKDGNWQNNWQKLIDIYGGHPLALNLISGMINELFSGSVAEFLKQEIIIFSDISNILDDHFYRLSTLEKHIMYWLAIEQDPVSGSTVHNNIILPITKEEFWEAIKSLTRRALIYTKQENGESLYTLQQVVIEYVTTKIIEKAYKEAYELILDIDKFDDLIATNSQKNPAPRSSSKLDYNEILKNTKVFKSLNLSKYKEKNNLRSQNDVILNSVLDKVRILVLNDSKIKSQLESLKERLLAKISLEDKQSEKPSLAFGYAYQNILQLYKIYANK